MNKFNLPTEVIDLPSMGLLYPKDNPLSSGKVEMKYMTAREEDILSNQSYITKGIVIDKLLQSLIVDKSVDYNTLLVCDKNAIMIAARILGYGKEYKFMYQGKETSIDLSKLDTKKTDMTLFKDGVNEFEFELPLSKNKVTWKILDHSTEQQIVEEIKGLQKIKKDDNPSTTTRFKYIITSVNGDTKPATIRDFVDSAFLSQDVRALRDEIFKVTPDIDLTFSPSPKSPRVNIPIGVSFFYPSLAF
jgi:hypothetical protein|tara:strand:+ start:829 stop:1566 length:738 start_codon:yes stop_codon:yes gene_type:complete